VPKDKHDVSTIEALKTIGIEKVVPVLPELLEWMKDGNWPCARELLNVMPRFHAELVPHVKNIFAIDDGEWKWFIFPLIERFPEETIALLLSCIDRVVSQPTPDEVHSEVYDIAYKFLDSLNDKVIDRRNNEIIDGNDKRRKSRNCHAV